MIEFSTFFLPDFMIRALLGGLGLAIVAGPLGAFMVWRKMAYFGDTLAHSGLLGVALAFLWGINLNVAILSVGGLVACLLFVLQQKTHLAADTLLGILAHLVLALGLIFMSLEPVGVDILGFLYGDILELSWSQVLGVYLGGSVILCVLAGIWKRLLNITVDEALAQVEGIPVKTTRFIYLLLLAFVVALAIKLVGVLMMTALLIIPSATAAMFSKSPEQMALFSSVVGGVAMMGGLGVSLWMDIPAGPAVVVMAGIFFGCSFLLKRVR